MTENDDGKQFDLIEGQLIPNGIPVDVAQKVSALASAGQWVTAGYLIEGNIVATRILRRVREMRHE